MDQSGLELYGLTDARPCLKTRCLVLEGQFKERGSSTLHGQWGELDGQYREDGH